MKGKNNLKQLLKEYYDLNIETLYQGYFQYHHVYYYFAKVPQSFQITYPYYQNLISALNQKGYQIIKNKDNHFMTKGYILFSFENIYFSLNHYFHITFIPLSLKPIRIKEIKENWIEKIDYAREKVAKYAYSFQYKKDLQALIYYYCGLGENAIMILNEIIKRNKNASIPLCYSLSKTISPQYYQLINPTNYKISTREKHLLYLIKSHILSLEQLQDYFFEFSFHEYEFYYLYACTFFHFEFFDYLQEEREDEQKIKYYRDMCIEDFQLIKKVHDIIINYVSLPEISWIE